MHGDGICRSVSGKRCPVGTGRSSLPSVYDGRGGCSDWRGYDAFPASVIFYVCCDRYFVRCTPWSRTGAGSDAAYMWRCMFDPYYMDVRCLPDSFRNQHDHAELSGFVGNYRCFVYYLLFYEIPKKRITDLTARRKRHECFEPGAYQ